MEGIQAAYLEYLRRRASPASRLNDIPPTEFNCLLILAHSLAHDNRHSAPLYLTSQKLQESRNPNSVLGIGQVTQLPWEVTNLALVSIPIGFQPLRPCTFRKAELIPAGKRKPQADQPHI